MNLSNISKYRGEMMGMSILWIMLFHSKIELNQFAILDFFKTIGYGGVDFFFFLSGFGLACSWLKKTYSLKKFYFRRYLKVLPTYWLVVIFYFSIYWLFTHRFQFSLFLSYLSGSNFLLYNDLTFWFIPCILICYTFFPFFILPYRKFKPVSVLVGLTVLGLIFSLAITWTRLNYLLILTIRIPIFVLGIHTGFIWRKTPDPDNGFWLHPVVNLALPAITITTLFLAIEYTYEPTRWQYGLWWYPFWLFPYSICLILSNGLGFLDEQYKENKILWGMKQSLLFLGRYSLEIYLMHAMIFQFGPHIYKKLPSIMHLLNYSRIPEFCIYSLLAIILAFPVKKSITIIPFIGKMTS